MPNPQRKLTVFCKTVYTEETYVKYHAIFTLALVFVFGSVPSIAQDIWSLKEMEIEQPWARASIGTIGPTAAYMKIHNTGTEADRLLFVSSPLSELVEVHRTSKNNGMMSMEPAGTITIAGKSTVALAPGELHLMLMKLKSPLVKGEFIQITLNFERTGTVTVTAPIYGVGTTIPK